LVWIYLNWKLISNLAADEDFVQAKKEKRKKKTMKKEKEKRKFSE
jgi:hypothetical protein